ncbi:class I SAM-dependent methyltransferase [Saliniramus sp.]|uniref:class I SAM-dependent methyltransferase n=1 Tax=Saliniramus sp. TaxID=2986772 RepID=UPI002CCD3E88|nr:class I SAM-dependent methyltransferase [Saliniramus sp.]HMB10952.1 class I SAM-dependent methyltransferase [Saliniramus sp.]
MTGFSADWLSLRESADHAARNGALMDKLADHLRYAGGARDSVEIIDLGCGTGSNLRAIAPALHQRQQIWRLVDHDAALLVAAREHLADWADEAVRDGDALELVKGERELHVSFIQGDLARDLDPVLDPPPDLVTAAALFDLCARDWIRFFANAVTRRRCAFYTALTYDGHEIWQPPHPADSAVLAAFHAHQVTDKGFGRSAGPEATQALSQAFENLDYTVETAGSPWRLTPDDAALIATLAEGQAQAVQQAGLVEQSQVEEWRAARTGSGVTCTIGHQDLLALPG